MVQISHRALVYACAATTPRMIAITQVAVTAIKTFVDTASGSSPDP